MKPVVTLALLLAVAGCGTRQTLRPADGASLPPRQLGVTTDLPADVLAKPDGQSRPLRSDELLRRSEQRRDDPFDLPPPG